MCLHASLTCVWCTNYMFKEKLEGCPVFGQQLNPFYFTCFKYLKCCFSVLNDGFLLGEAWGLIF